MCLALFSFDSYHRGWAAVGQRTQPGGLHDCKVVGQASCDHRWCHLIRRQVDEMPVRAVLQSAEEIVIPGYPRILAPDRGPCAVAPQRFLNLSLVYVEYR